MKFRKKPVVIEAVQWLGDNASYAHISRLMGIHPTLVGSPQHEEVIIIKTLEGDHQASVDDWIIKGVQGEIYPCKPDIFELTYERVENGEKK